MRTLTAPELAVLQYRHGNLTVSFLLEYKTAAWNPTGALTMLDVDAQGLDVMDRKLLLTVIEKFTGGPVGVDNLASAIGEERDTIEDVLEPYLIQQGYLQRTPRGRIATANAYKHFGLAQPRNANIKELWDE